MTAAINAQGNGISLTDTIGGTGTMALTETDGGTTLADLNLAAPATAGVIDGALQQTVDVTATDTLTTLQDKINKLGFGVSASIINDGSSTTPYRLSLTARHSGTAGRVTIDSGTTGLNTTTLIKAQDAAVFYGSGDGSNALLLTSSTNTLSNVIKGVNVTLNGVSKTPVTLNVTRDTTAVTKQLTDFATNFNALVDKIDTLTRGPNLK